MAVGTTMWLLWRNNLIFQEQLQPPVDPFLIAISTAREFHYGMTVAKAVNGIKGRVEDRWVRWIPPIAGWYKLNCDGARDVRTGVACSGGIVRDSSGQWCIGYSHNVGHCSALEAELWGILQGLRISIQKAFHKLHVERDSWDAMQLLTSTDGGRGAWPIVRDCRTLMRCFSDIKVEHIFREANGAADFLAKQGFAQRQGVIEYQDCPMGLRPHLALDALGAHFCRAA